MRAVLRGMKKAAYVIIFNSDALMAQAFVVMRE
jgi:hypothetical protein